MITIFAIFFSAGVIFGYGVSPQIKDEAYNEIIEYVEMQTDIYGDLCAESRTCQQYYDPENEETSEYCTDEAAVKRDSGTLLIEAHYEGVQCASESIKSVVEDLKERR